MSDVTITLFVFSAIYGLVVAIVLIYIYWGETVFSLKQAFLDFIYYIEEIYFNDKTDNN